MTEKEQAIDKLVEKLHISIEEAQEVYESDKAIDKGLPQDFDLSPERKKVAQKYTRTGTRAYKFTKKAERKPDAPKEEIIASLADFLKNKAEYLVSDCEIVNPTKLITFVVNGEHYKLDLIRQRKPK